SVLAAPDDRPSALTRKGKPHSSVNTVVLNCAVKCDHMPSRVPGLPQTSRRLRPSARILIRVTESLRYGESLTRSATGIIRNRPGEAARAKLLVQPKRASANDKGAAAKIAPSWPTWPVTCVTTGACRTRNHKVTSLITLTNTVASPAPITALARTATGN